MKKKRNEYGAGEPGVFRVGEKVRVTSHLEAKEYDECVETNSLDEARFIARRWQKSIRDSGELEYNY